MFNDYKVGVTGLGYAELPFFIAIAEKYKDVGY